MAAVNVIRETHPDGATSLSGESCRYTFRRPRTGLLHVEIEGQEIGELGRAPLGEVAGEAALHAPLRVFIDMQRLTHVAGGVSEVWTAWFRTSRALLKRVDVLAPSPSVGLVVAVSQRFSETEKILRLHRDAAEFAVVLRDAVGA